MQVTVIRPHRAPTVQFTGREVSVTLVEDARNHYETVWDECTTKLKELESNDPRDIHPWGESDLGSGTSFASKVRIEQFEKDLAALETRQAYAAKALKIIALLMQAADARVASLDKVQKDSGEGGKTPVTYQYRYPVVDSGSTKVEIHHRCKVPLNRALYPWLLSLWTAVRGKASDCLQYAPAYAEGPGGKPVPMAEEKAVLLVKWQKGAEKARPHELIAHYWLIVSWNRAHPSKVVPLPKGSRNPYKRTIAPSKKAEAVTSEVSQLVEDLRDLITEARAKKLPTAVVPSGGVSAHDVVGTAFAELALHEYGSSEVYQVKIDNGKLLIAETPGKKNLVSLAALEVADLKAQLAREKSRINDLERILDELEEENRQLQEAVAPSPTDNSEEDATPSLPGGERPPEVFFEGQTVWYLDPSNVQGPKVSKVIFGTDYFRQYTEIPKPRGAAAPPKGGGAVPQKPREASTGGKTASVPAGENAKGDPITRENPLRAKGVPRSNLLTEEQKARIRKVLGILVPEPLDPDTWATMSPKSRSQYRKSGSIPHWASSAVLENKDNLELIEQKILTASNQRSRLRGLVRGDTSRPNKGAAEAWATLKKRYPGASLFSNPRSKAEKALKAGWDNLRAEFGKHPSLPKPKVKAGSKTTQPARIGGGNGLDQLIPMLSLIGKLAKAFT
jgi:hypothetical protein